MGVNLAAIAVHDSGFGDGEIGDSTGGIAQAVVEFERQLMLAGFEFI